MMCFCGCGKPFLMSAIMPTRGRRDLAQCAVECFRQQTFPDRELIILDDEQDPSFPEGIFGPGIRHIPVSTSMNIPQKRNLACTLALGCVIIHWDSDDWSSPDRIALQGESLMLSGKKVGGFNSMLFYEQEKDRAFRYKAGFPNYAVGTSLIYFRSWWELHRFDEAKNIGEDNEFVSIARRSSEIACEPGKDLMVALIHSKNTSQKTEKGDNFIPVDRREIPERFFAACKRGGFEQS